jgi:hypothetical protein
MPAGDHEGKDRREEEQDVEQQIQPIYA